MQSHAHRKMLNSIDSIPRTCSSYILYLVPLHCITHMLHCFVVFISVYNCITILWWTWQWCFTVLYLSLPSAYSRVLLPLVFEVLHSILMAFEVEHSISSLSPNEMKIPHSRWSFFVSYFAEKPKYSLKRMFTSLQFDPKRTIENC